MTALDHQQDYLTEKMVRLCKHCRKATGRPTNKDWLTYHCSTYDELKRSVLSGCDLCRLLQHALLNEYKSRFGHAFEATEQYQLELDQSNTDPRTGKPASPFIFSNRLVDIDAEYSPYDSGTVGFWFYRAQDQDEVSMAVDQVDCMIAFKTPTGSMAQRVGKVIGAQTSGQSDIQVAKKWIQDCKDRHPHHRCGPFTDVALPTRVLDVLPSSGADHVRLRVTNGSPGRYITLSHRWGDPNRMPIKLTQETIERLRNGIAISSLPMTFQDAVMVTRALGYAYLWIDSLCILQDSADDWQKAVAEMPNIYNQAELNICGPAAADCTAGFLHDRRLPPESNALQVPWRIEQGSTRQPLGLVYRGDLPNHGDPPHVEPNSALATRGWILQERLLSQRMLYFGSRNMYWECNTNASYETLHFPLPNDSKLRTEVPKISFNTCASKDMNAPALGWRWTWYELLGTYSSMDLSFQTDKLVAISALAQRFSQVLQDEYVAGLWKSELFKGLAWYVDRMKPQTHDLPEPPTAYPPSPYMAPSWSWASTTMGINHVRTTETWVSIAGETAEIVNIAVTPVSHGNPYSSIVSGSSMTLRSPSFQAGMKLKPFNVKDLKDYGPFKRVKRWKAYYKHQGPEDLIELGTFFPDHQLSGADDMEHELLCLPIAVVSSKITGARTSKSTLWSVIALVVEKIPGDEPGNKYRRRGLLLDESQALYGIKDEGVLFRRLLQDDRHQLGLFEIV